MGKLYPQPALNVEEQIELLTKKGLLIGDAGEVRQFLLHVSYFRLRDYTFFFKDYEKLGGNFLPGTSFDQLATLYSFDQKLKLILFEALENIEVAVKTQLSNTYSCTFGPHWYLDETLYIDKKQHGAFMQKLREECQNHDEHFIRRYMESGFEPDLPPSWMIMEIITFGAVSRLFENLASSDAKNFVCMHFGLPKNIMVSWLHCFTHIRNKCSHHARVVYKNALFSPIFPSKKSRVFLKEHELVDNTKIYAALCCIAKMLESCNAKSSFRQNIKTLIRDFPRIDYERLGFTPEWREESIWQ